MKLLLVHSSLKTLTSKLIHVTDKCIGKETKEQLDAKMIEIMNDFHAIFETYIEAREEIVNGTVRQTPTNTK